MQFQKMDSGVEIEQREIVKIVKGKVMSDGDGVQLTRLVGGSELELIDPFLMLDRFESDQAQDYIGGFPDHPHRGFEAVTYLLAGRIRHRDNAGHSGVIGAGDVQWMSAGRGIIHSEMPEQEEGLLSGFQLWINLPAEEKMKNPEYQEFVSSRIPVAKFDGGSAKIIAGTNDQGVVGAISGIATQPLFMDIVLDIGGEFHQAISASHAGFIYVIEGEVQCGDVELAASELGVLGDGDKVTFKAKTGSRFLLIAGKPLNEPVARGGPFVMNTREELVQAFDDFRNGRF